MNHSPAVFSLQPQDVVPHPGHYIHEDRPEEVAEALPPWFYRGFTMVLPFGI